MTARPKALQVGHVYFACGYVHPKHLVPEIETYVYVGKNLFAEDRDAGHDVHYFQGPRKYFEEDVRTFERDMHALEGLPEDEDSEREEPEADMLLVHDPDIECNIYDLDGLIEFLSKDRGGSIF